MSRNIHGYLDGGSRAEMLVEIWWREVRDAAEHLTRHRISSPTPTPHTSKELFLPQMSKVLSLRHLYTDIRHLLGPTIDKVSERTHIISNHFMIIKSPMVTFKHLRAHCKQIIQSSQSHLVKYQNISLCSPGRQETSGKGAWLSESSFLHCLALWPLSCHFHTL